jgi:hypothetical protein
MIENLRLAICEKFFFDCLDKAFIEGYREGKRDMMNTVGFRVRNQERSLTPAREEGYTMAVAAIDEIKKGLQW